MDATRKPWQQPQLTTFGSVAEVTQQEGKFKVPGSGDDFFVNASDV